MAISGQAEIHIHGSANDEPPLSVCMQSKSTAEARNIAEIGLLCCFAIRTMSNFGTSPYSDKIASLLMQTKQLILDPVWLNGEACGGTTLMPHVGKAGKGAVFVDMTLTSNEGVRFNIDYRRFGLLARGMDIYAIASLVALIRFLALNHAEDQIYLRALAQAGTICSQFYCGRAITMNNHPELVGKAIVAACDPYLDAATQQLLDG